MLLHRSCKLWNMNSSHTRSTQQHRTLIKSERFVLHFFIISVFILELSLKICLIADMTLIVTANQNLISSSFSPSECLCQIWTVSIQVPLRQLLLTQMHSNIIVLCSAVFRKSPICKLSLLPDWLDSYTHVFNVNVCYMNKIWLILTFHWQADRGVYWHGWRWKEWRHPGMT